MTRPARIATSKAEVQPWDHWHLRGANGHPLQIGEPIGSKIRHPRVKLLQGGLPNPDPFGRRCGPAFSYALACRL